jgi:DNA-binding NarL/FixJ family response regulator
VERAKTAKKRVVVYAEGVVAQSGFRSLLGQSYKVILCEDKTSLTAALAVSPQLDVVLVNFSASFGLAGVQGLCHHKLVVMLLDGHELAAHLIEMGVKGVIFASTRQSEIIQAIENVSMGQTYLPASIVNALNCGDMKSVYLYRQYMRVAFLVAEGLNNREIGKALGGLSEHTVKVYLSKFFPDLGVRQRGVLSLIMFRNFLYCGKWIVDWRPKTPTIQTVIINMNMPVVSFEDAKAS